MLTIKSCFPLPGKKAFVLFGVSSHGHPKFLSLFKCSCDFEQKKNTLSVLCTDATP